jgi:hypothetical protein
MKLNKTHHTIILIFLIQVVWAAEASAEEPVQKAPEFSLTDQYSRCYEITYPQKKVCVMVFAGKWGSIQVEGWVKPLYEHYRDSITILGVARLESVPEFLRSAILRLFRKIIRFSVIMDWTGNLSRSYEYTGRNAHLVIISRQGTIRHRENGRATKERIEKCFEIIDKLNSPVPDTALTEKHKVKKN